MMDQIMILDTEGLNIEQSVMTEFGDTDNSVDCMSYSTQMECNMNSGCEWSTMGMGMCMEGMSSNTVNTPHYIVLDEINGYWFVTTIASGFVAQYSLVNNTLIDAYFVGDAPALLAVDPENKKIYCSRMMPMNGMGNMMPSSVSNIIQGLNYNSMGMSESANQTYIINSPAPHGLAINDDGTELYTVSNTADWLYKINTINPFPKQKARPCVFEYIYFARPDSILNGQSAYQYRKRFGTELANEDNIKADIVVPVPDSGNAAALGYSQKKNIDFVRSIIWVTTGKDIKPLVPNFLKHHFEN